MREIKLYQKFHISHKQYSEVRHSRIKELVENRREPFDKELVRAWYEKYTGGQDEKKW